MLVDPNMHEITHFCLPHLKSNLKHATSYLHEVSYWSDLYCQLMPFLRYDSGSSNMSIVHADRK